MVFVQAQGPSCLIGSRRACRSRVLGRPRGASGPSPRPSSARTRLSAPAWLHRPPTCRGGLRGGGGGAAGAGPAPTSPPLPSIGLGGPAAHNKPLPCWGRPLCRPGPAGVGRRAGGAAGGGERPRAVGGRGPGRLGRPRGRYLWRAPRWSCPCRWCRGCPRSGSAPWR